MLPSNEGQLLGYPKGTVESVYQELALYGRKISALGLILSFPPNPNSALARFPLENLNQNYFFLN